MLSELHNKINQIVPIKGLNQNDDGSYTIHYFSIPTESENTLINNILESWPLEEAKLLKLKSAEEEWNQTIKNGWTTSYGWKLGLDIQDVTLLTGLFMLAKESSNLGLNDPVHIIDTDGISHELNLLELTTLMLQYGQARSLLSSNYAIKKLAITQATTLEELENI